MPLIHRFLLLFGFFPALLMSLAACDECATSYKICDPEGASLRDVPVIGPDLGRLYLELLYTVKSAHAPRQNQVHRSTGRDADDGKSLCCVEGADCLLTQSFHIALCWDKFTTNYFLTDGSFGTLSNGTYMTSNGDEANLITGEYKMANGETGNIYDQDPADKPDTFDLPMPTPFTSKGVGSAIPGSALGATPTSGAMPSDVSDATTSSSSKSSASSTLSSSTVGITSTTILSTSTITSSVTIHSTSTFSVTAATSTGGGYGGYGGPSNSTTTASPSVTGTSGASMVTVFTSSPIFPSINTAAAHFIHHVVPTLLITVVGAVLVG